MKSSSECVCEVQSVTGNVRLTELICVSAVRYNEVDRIDLCVPICRDVAREAVKCKTGTARQKHVKVRVLVCEIVRVSASCSPPPNAIFLLSHITVTALFLWITLSSHHITSITFTPITGTAIPFQR